MISIYYAYSSNMIAKHVILLFYIFVTRIMQAFVDHNCHIFYIKFVCKSFDEKTGHSSSSLPTDIFNHNSLINIFTSCTNGNEFKLSNRFYFTLLS